MATFDQRNQTVIYQYNANGSINFGAVRDSSDLKNELGKLKSELLAALKAANVEEDAATDAKYMLDKALNESKKAEVDNGRVLVHLEKLKEVVGGIAALTGLVGGITEAITTVKKFVP